jgi:hypothetical protein
VDEANEVVLAPVMRSVKKLDSGVETEVFLEIDASERLVEVTKELRRGVSELI